MSFINSIFGWYSSQVPAIMVVIAILLIGIIIARLNIITAIRSAIYVGVGIVGLNAMIGMFASVVIPTLMQVIERTGMKLQYLDFGVTAMQSSIVFPLEIFALLLPVGLIVNAIMIFLKLTDTFDVDIFNYWIWGITGALVYFLTGSVIWAMVAYIINEIIVLKMADFTAPIVQKYYGIEGVSIPHGNAVVFAPIGYIVDKVIDKIPVLNKININPETIQSRFGTYVEPSLLGFVMGIVFGIVAGYDSTQVLNVAITIAAFMILFPRMLSCLIEGITPVSEGMREITEKKFKRKIHIGLDAAILVGMPSVLSTGILLVPIILLLAFILPGNKVLPLADLAIAAPFLITLCMPYCKGNIFKGLISGTIVFILALYIAGDLAPIISETAVMNGLPVGEPGTIWTSLGGASSPVIWVLVKIAQLFS